ncbi:hypothetical protein V8E53_005882 [Lactarius tabidus]
MGICSSCSTVTVDQPPVTVAIATSRQERSGFSSSTTLGRESPRIIKDVPIHELPRNRSKSTPQKPSPMTAGEDLPPVPSHRSRAKSSIASSSRSPSTPVSAVLPKARPRRPNLTSPSRRSFNSSLREALPEHFKFRILVVGKSRSGKSSLIKTVFKVDMAAASEKADINIEFRPADNRYLIVHECSGFDSQTRDSQDSQTIRDFISRRTDASCLPPERLHAIWICVPASDAFAGRLGDGVKEILALRNVPVVLVFTKFDMVVSQVLLDRFSGAPQHYERARASAHTTCEESCRRIFDKEPRDVPVEIVSEKGRFSDLIENLVVTTDGLITGSRGSTRAEYWRSPCPAFADQKLKNCVNIIHDDIVEIWNLNDKTGYLLNDNFKAKMSHLVKDLAGSASATSSISGWTGAVDDYADWVHKPYRASPENVCCVVGYIVDLTIILDGIFRMAAGNISPNHAEQVLGRHDKSGRKDAIHRDIRNFIAEVYEIKVLQKDLVLEKIIDLI